MRVRISLATIMVAHHVQYGAPMRQDDAFVAIGDRVEAENPGLLLRIHNDGCWRKTWADLGISRSDDLYAAQAADFCARNNHPTTVMVA